MYTQKCEVEDIHQIHDLLHTKRSYLNMIDDIADADHSILSQR
jgi:hypothetical protein